MSRSTGFGCAARTGIFAIDIALGRSEAARAERLAELLRAMVAVSGVAVVSG